MKKKSDTIEGGDMSTLVPEMISLTAQDRCDRCGAQARHAARQGDMELLFCNHHFDANAKGLLEQGWRVISDETQKIDSSHSDA